MNTIKKSNIFKWLIVLAIIVLFFSKGIPYLQRSARENVENDITCIYNLCDFAARPIVGKTLLSTPAEALLESEIVGISETTWADLEINEEAYVFNLYLTEEVHAGKIASNSRPILYYFEVYEHNDDYYLKAFYMTTRRNDDFYAYYKFSHLAQELTEQLKESSYPEWWSNQKINQDALLAQG